MSILCVSMNCFVDISYICCTCRCQCFFGHPCFRCLFFWGGRVAILAMQKVESTTQVNAHIVLYLQTSKELKQTSNTYSRQLLNDKSQCKCWKYIQKRHWTEKHVRFLNLDSYIALQFIYNSCVSICWNGLTLRFISLQGQTLEHRQP